MKDEIGLLELDTVIELVDEIQNKECLQYANGRVVTTTIRYPPKKRGIIVASDENDTIVAKFSNRNSNSYVLVRLESNEYVIVDTA